MSSAQLQCLNSMPSEFLLERQEMLTTMVTVARENQMNNCVVFLAAAFLDISYVLEDGILTLDLHLQSLAVFVLAVKFTGLPAHAQQPFSLSRVRSSWWQKMHVLGHPFHFNVKQLAAAELHVAQLLAWRLHIATADKFLDAFLQNHQLETSLCMDQWAVFFVDLSVMNIVLGARTQSMHAAASIMASRSVLELPALTEAEQLAHYGFTEPQAALELLVEDLLQLYATRIALAQTPTVTFCNEEMPADDDELFSLSQIMDYRESQDFCLSPASLQSPIWQGTSSNEPRENAVLTFPASMTSPLLVFVFAGLAVVIIFLLVCDEDALQDDSPQEKKKESVEHFHAPLVRRARREVIESDESDGEN